MAFCPSELTHHSSRECALPPLPPLPIVIAGMPNEIGMFESVEPLVSSGVAPKYEVAAIALWISGRDGSNSPERTISDLFYFNRQCLASSSNFVLLIQCLLNPPGSKVLPSHRGDKVQPNGMSMSMLELKGTELIEVPPSMTPTL